MTYPWVDSEKPKPQLPTDYTIHFIARVKAKWGISYGMLANYLSVSSRQSREWSEKGNAPLEIKEAIIRLDDILEKIMQEQKVLGIDNTYVQALKHEIELDRKELEASKSKNFSDFSKIQALKNNLSYYKSASFWQRICYLFNPYVDVAPKNL